MIVVKVEIHSAITGEVKNLGSVVIDNIGGSKHRGSYRARAFRAGAINNEKNEKGASWSLPRNKNPTRETTVNDHPRLTEPVWSLVSKALKGLKY